MKNITKRQFVYVVEMSDDVMCMGVYDNYFEAVGRMMDSIWEFSESYKKDGDMFSFSEPVWRDDSESGMFVEVEFKAACWSHSEKEIHRILFNDICEDVKDGDSDDD